MATKKIYPNWVNVRMNWIKANWETPKKDGWYLCWMYYGGWEKLYYWWNYDVFSEDAARYTKEDEHRAFSTDDVLYWAEVEE